MAVFIVSKKNSFLSQKKFTTDIRSQVRWPSKKCFAKNMQLQHPPGLSKFRLSRFLRLSKFLRSETNLDINTTYPM